MEALKFRQHLPGKFLSVLNPTPDTGIAQSIIAAFSATDAILSIFNTEKTDVPGPNRAIYMDSIRLINTVVPASATRVEVLLSMDTKDRFTSGGSVLTPVNPNTQVAQDDRLNNAGAAQLARVNFGALLLNAESTDVRRFARATFKNQIPTQFEETIILFNQPVIGVATNTTRNNRVGPCLIAPGSTFVMHLWSPGNAVTAASWEVEIGMWIVEARGNFAAS